MTRFGPVVITLLAFILSQVTAQALLAHPISLSSAVVDVKPGVIEAEIEIMLEDLVLYHSLAADGNNLYSAADLKQAAAKHQKFLLDYFTILDADGGKLVGQVASTSLDQIDEAGVGQTELMRRTIIFKINYAFEGKPKFLTFLQNFGGDRAVLPSVMDMHVLKSGHFGEKAAQLQHGRPHTVALDWDRPESGQRLTLAQLREQRKQQLQDRLGIASYTGLFSFVYITRFEVRHEILIPLLTLEQWQPIPRKDKDFLEVDEQAEAGKLIEEFFRTKSHVEINGREVPAQLSRLNFFGLDINDFALNAEPRRMNVAQARLGVILSFPADQSPHEVKVRWNTFSEYAPYMQSVVLVGNEAPRPHDFQSLDETFQWTGQLTSPTITPVNALPAANESQRKRTIKDVLENIYHAFEFRRDEDVYDALASSVDGNLLRDLYLKVKRTLLVAEQGGALSHVTQVNVVSASPVAGNASTFEVVWTVTGVTEHWGHLHNRETQYRARLTFSSLDGHCKLQKFQLLDEKRLKFETSIRGYDPNQ